MSRATIVIVLSLGLSALAAPQAGAFVPGPSPTHDEFIAQLDSVCQPFVAPLNGGFNTFAGASSQLNRSAKRAIRAHKHGNRKAEKKAVKAFVRAARLTGNSLNALAQLESNLLDQINTLTPPAEGWVISWVGHVKAEQSAIAAAGTAILLFRIDQFFSSLHQADAAQTAAHQDIAGVGLQVCTALIVP